MNEFHNFEYKISKNEISRIRISKNHNVILHPKVLLKNYVWSIHLYRKEYENLEKISFEVWGCRSTLIIK